MLNHKGFDLWADGYDKSVGLSDEANTYPFAGYKKVLAAIFQTVMQTPNASVLDIGFGSAVAVSGTGQGETPESLAAPAFTGFPPVVENGTKAALTTGMTTDRKIFIFTPRRGIMAEK